MLWQQRRKGDEIISNTIFDQQLVIELCRFIWWMSKYLSKYEIMHNYEPKDLLNYTHWKTKTNNGKYIVDIGCFHKSSNSIFEKMCEMSRAGSIFYPKIAKHYFIVYLIYIWMMDKQYNIINIYSFLFCFSGKCSQSLLDRKHPMTAHT